MIVEDMIKTLTEEIGDMISTKTVVGEHITIGDRTIIPVTKVSFGFGSGGGEGAIKAGEQGSGGGGGGGAVIQPVGFLVITPEDVLLLDFKGKSALTYLAEIMPEMAEKCKSIMEKRHEKKEEPEE